MNNVVRLLLLAIGGLILLGSTVLYFGTNKANTLIDEANIAIAAGNDAAKHGGEIYGQLFTEANLRNFPSNRHQLAPTAKDLAAHLDRAALNFDLAAKKFEDAAKQNVAATHAEYWKTKQQAFIKFAQSKRAFQSVAQLITDQKIATIDNFNAKMSPLIDEAVKADDEAKSLSAKADEIRDRNKDGFN
jgi:hypothetical protein